MANDADNYIGLWTTAEKYVREQLLPCGRYVEARGENETAYKGSYQISGTHIEYQDDTGFHVDGDFVELDVLHHVGMILHRTANP